MFLLNSLQYDDIKKKFNVMTSAITISSIFGVGDAVEVLFTDTMRTDPAIIPNSVVIKVDGNAVGTDDANGVITGATIEAGSIVYETGSLSVEFSAGNAPGDGLAVTIEYNVIPQQTKYDILSNYFISLGYSGTMSDMEDQFLTANSQAASVGTFADRWSAYLAGLTPAITGRLSDALRTWARRAEV
jgi:hypothetical protein